MPTEEAFDCRAFVVEVDWKRKRDAVEGGWNCRDIRGWGATLVIYLPHNPLLRNPQRQTLVEVHAVPVRVLQVQENQGS